MSDIFVLTILLVLIFLSLGLIQGLERLKDK